MRASVIVTSYNQPKSLKLGLCALALQDNLDFEVIVADDGSMAELAEMVANFAATAPFPIRFITQEDAGFRKSTAINKAILAAKSEKIIFMDGDCVPFSNHVSMHVAHLRPGYFCVGGVVMLPLEESRALRADDFKLDALKRFLTDDAVKPLRKKHRSSCFQAFWGSRRAPRIFGCNCSFMRNDLFTVNGYDETFNNQGKEDSDLRNRMRNNGFKGISLITKDIVCHLDHGLDKDSRNSTNKRKKDSTYYKERKHALTAAKGLNELLCRQD